MKSILMNKNTEVLVAEYNEVSKFFDEIIEIKNIEYAPLIIKNIYKSGNIDELKITLSNWFRGRGIPAWRDRIDILLARLNITTPDELLNKSFGLSLSDQYWLKPYDIDIKYDDINFFDHDFDYSEFLEASLSNNNKSISSEKSLETPNNTTDGMLKKAWTIKDNKRYLIKGGYKNDVLQPFNEVLATKICERLGFEHIKYDLVVMNNKVCSICECYTSKDTEFIPASQILYGKDKKHSIEDYNNYIKILEENSIKNAREKIENMFVLDYLIMNEDRHLNNFGIIRNVNNLKWIEVMPIFDNGQALNIIDYDNDELAIAGEGKFFYNVETFENIISVVKNIKRIDISKLDGVVEEYDKLLHEYQNITSLSDKKINALCILLKRQIDSLISKIS